LLRFAARLILGGVFIYAGLAKIAAPSEFARIVVNYQILPETMAVYAAYVLPWFEVALGLFAIMGLGVKKIALALSFLLILFMVAVVIRYGSGLSAPCGCFSLKTSGSESIFVIIGRDAGLLACAAYLFLGKEKLASHQTPVA